MRPIKDPVHGTAKGCGCKKHEIEPGRSVPSRWDNHLFETWAERKARRAAGRTEGVRS
ncbi:MAG: hypothetical protein ACR2F8_02905 [Caulobacteraceae bacterium]